MKDLAMKARTDLSIAGALLVFCLVNQFYLIPTQVVAEGSSPVYPMLINIMLAVFSMAYFWEGLRLLRKQPANMQSAKTAAERKNPAYWRPLALLLIAGGWILVMDWMGFIASTFVFLMLAARLFGSKSLWKALVLSIAMPLILYFIFRSLNSLLPQGPLEKMLEVLFS